MTRQPSDWPKEVQIVTNPIKIVSKRSGRVLNYLRNAVSKLKPTNEQNHYVPHVELECKTEKEARNRYSALYAARRRLLQEDGVTYKPLKFKLQGPPRPTIIIWLEK